MCVICYELTADEHWSDAISDAGDRAARARHRRVGALRSALAPFGLKVADPRIGRSVVVSNRTGASEVASGLPAVWVAAERLAGRPVDVLDPALLDALESARTAEGR